MTKKIIQLPSSEDLDLSSLSWLWSLLTYHQCCDELFISNHLHTLVLDILRDQLAADRKVVVIIPLVRSLVNLCAARDECVQDLLNVSHFGATLLELLNFSYECVCKEAFILVSHIFSTQNPLVADLLENAKLSDLIEMSASRVALLFSNI